jgi:AhpD family alkylhydroperoxidase
MSRMRLKDTAPEPYTALADADLAIRKGPLDSTLQELVKVHVSRLNGRAFCIDKHTRAARTLGADEERIAQLSRWSESSLFNAAERAALAYAEAVTRVDDPAGEHRPALAPSAGESLRVGAHGLSQVEAVL